MRPFVGSEGFELDCVRVCVLFSFELLEDD
jgi:hypothetical protein